ncbi:MAG: bifunctional isocitrate dehydrogenase kinase/phosphatase [Actinomycetia bacterium]|nr:bifunctional isocitrate dehydrogenase kinase/phosphatase [Actinomycetes bacterium]
MTVSPDQLASRLAIGFTGFRRRFQSISRRATARFESRDWVSLHRDALDRIDAYGKAVDETIASVLSGGYDVTDRSSWSQAKDLYRDQHLDDPFQPVAETFFNSVTRKLFTTEGVDAELEFLEAPRQNTVPADSVLTRIYTPEDRRSMVEALLRDCRFHASWFDLQGDLDAAVAHFPDLPDRVEVIDRLFFRGKGAYLVGSLNVGDEKTPFALAIRHKREGLVLAAVMIGEADVSVLFSYTRSAFLISVDQPEGLVAFLSDLLPQRRHSEVYASIGFRKQAKTERYRDLASYLAGSDDRFEHAPGIEGLVMVVFTLPGYDVVFKVVRDRFPPQKSVTPQDVASRYRVVARHDRGGRLVEAQRFVDLRLPADRFDPDLLAELKDKASRNVSVVENEVTIKTVYVERRVIPLDIYLREASREQAAKAIIDYGAAIKNLAASNIFPGDMLLKNFGVTNRGRVVFYDYDEICKLTDCTFRRFPETDDPYDDMSETPSFGVGPNDIFPEELPRFLGLRPELRIEFDRYHADLFDIVFWNRVKARIETGEIIEILPYRRSRALK